MFKVCQYLKPCPKHSHYAQYCSHLFAYHYVQNYAGIIHQGLEECEAKAVGQYPTPRGKMTFFLSYLVNFTFYTIALFQLLRQVYILPNACPLRMPQTIPSGVCILAAMWKQWSLMLWVEAMSTNALGFTNVAMTAETKSLRMVLLVTRKLKKFALIIVPTRKSEPMGYSRFCPYFKSRTEVFICIHSKPPLYTDFTVYAVNAGENISEKTACASVRHHFDYFLKQCHMNLSQVKSKMEQFCFLGPDILNELKGERSCALL